MIPQPNTYIIYAAENRMFQSRPTHCASSTFFAELRISNNKPCDSGFLQQEAFSR